MRELRNCTQCPRLTRALRDIRETYPDYHGRPVAPFGDTEPSLLIVGLAPGLHGANATGRPFTGDHAGILLYQTLYQHGFSNQPESHAMDDGLTLRDCRITNAVKCWPPENKPTTAEVQACNPYLARDLKPMRAGGLILTLGRVAHQAVLRALALTQSQFPFGHGREYALPGGQTLLASYHCSRYNTQTRRLTPEMFHAIFARARAFLDSQREGGR